MEELLQESIREELLWRSVIAIAGRFLDGTRMGTNLIKIRNSEKPVGAGSDNQFLFNRPAAFPSNVRPALNIPEFFLVVQSYLACNLCDSLSEPMSEAFTNGRTDWSGSEIVRDEGMVVFQARCYAL